MMTGSVRSATSGALLTEGAYAVLMKPFEAAELLEVFRSVEAGQGTSIRFVPPIS
jgi:hypothetical protein